MVGRMPRHPDGTVDQAPGARPARWLSALVVGAAGMTIVAAVAAVEPPGEDAVSGTNAPA